MEEVAAYDLLLS